MKKLAFASSAAALGLGALLVAHTSHAADHLDGPAASGNPMADIGDLYAWMTPDATKVNLVMTVSPGDDGTRHFGSTIQYAFHVTAQAGYGMATGAVETDIICTFASDTSAQCWVGSGTGASGDYVTGDASAAAGITSADGKLKVFAGHRADAFFFDLSGFRDAVSAVETKCGDAQCTGLTFDAAGCPTLDGGTATALGNLLKETSSATAAAPCTGANNVADCFASLNVMAIVVQVDKTLLSSSTNPLLAVWASTHTAP